MNTIGKYYKKSVKKSGTKKLSRKFYKSTGLINPIKKGKLSSSRLFKDVQMLKNMINAEKKQITLNTVSTTVGQVNGANSQAFYLLDVTPVISQGITGTTRNGNSVKIHSMVLKGQLIQQSAAVQAQRIKVEFFMNKSTTLSTSGLIGAIYDPNTLNGLYDINSTRALDTYKNFYCVSRKYYTINQDNQANVTGFKDITIPLKFKSWHVKYDDNNSNSITNGQMIMIVTADSGNVNPSTTSTITTIPVIAPSTGSAFNFFINYWYYDN